jgi:signal transduction histidine kinase
MLLLVSDLLDSYKIDLNKVQIFKEVSDINELISNIIKDHSPQYEAKGLELEADLDTKVKELAIDKMKFTQVMQNLLSNSMKYTEKGKVIVKTKQGKNEVIVEVIDTGIGIPDETKSKLFSRFTQLEGSIKSKFKGTGLGLSVVKGIVEAHHGKILVLDNKPHGSIFQIHLPVE